MSMAAAPTALPPTDQPAARATALPPPQQHQPPPPLPALPIQVAAAAATSKATDKESNLKLQAIAKLSEIARLVDWLIG